jgi:GDPmannose 4,6-dehydratase
MKTAFITGISGQDGSYLTEFLLSKGYAVHGMVRRSSTIDRARLDHLTSNPDIYNKRLFLHYCDLDDITNIRRILRTCAPDELYHLAGQSHVGLSFTIPESTCDFTAMGTLRLLEVLRDLDKVPRFLNIGSSEIFGQPTEHPQDLQTPNAPVSPYGVAKSFAVQMTRVYRDSFGIFACNAICYNHESPRRGSQFVSRKIAISVAEISKRRDTKLQLGNIETERDWGYAPEYVDAMWRILQQHEPHDVVLATGELTSLRDFLTYSFSHVGLNWEDHVVFDERLMRPTEPVRLVGDPAGAERLLNWKAKTSVRDLAHLMVDAELAT